jgi:predicted GH43/DUF377 family glycosyl hydrolase
MSIRHFIRAMAPLGLLMLVFGCAEDDSGPGDTRSDSVGAVFPSFVREPADRPVIGSGVAGVPGIVSDPCVVADEEGYHLFYTAFFCRRPDGSFYYSWDPEHSEQCDLRSARGSTAYAFSRDRGLGWEFRSTPVILPGAADWNDGDIETPFVCRVADRLFLFYSSFGSREGALLEHRFQLGAATFDLAGRSIREALLGSDERFAHRSEPVVAADFNERFGINNAQEPSVVVRDGRLELYFVSLGLSLPGQDFNAPDQEVSLAIRVALLDDQLSLIEAPSSPLLTGAAANIPEVRFFDGRYHLFATTTDFDDHEDDQIMYAVSENGRHFTAPKTILRRRDDVSFDNWGLMAPTVVVEPDEVVLFYTAWEKQERRCVLYGPTGRMGMPQESRPQSARCLYTTLARAVSTRE